MHLSLRPERPGRRGRLMTAGAVAIAAAALGVVMTNGGSVDRPAPPGGALAEQLDALRGVNDLVRATRTEVGHDPALYPTAYGRLEAALSVGHRVDNAFPAVRTEALADLARTDALDTPAWRAYYVCLALGAAKEPDAVVGADAAQVLERAGIREGAESEALAYLRAPDPGDDPLTSLATRAAFLQTLTCLDRDNEVDRARLDRLAADTARTAEAVPVLYAVDALRAVGVRAQATRALRDADTLLGADCERLDPLQRAALALLRGQVPERTRACLLPSLRDSDPQTRWMVRRALTSPAHPAEHGQAGPEASRQLPAPRGDIRADGLVDKSPAQLGTLTATYNAARALTAAAQQDRTPAWLEKSLRRLGRDPAIEPSDRILLAMACHRLSLACGPQADKGAKEATRLEVPARLTADNQRSWYGAMAARAEFGLGCPRTSVDLPEEKAGTLSPRALRVVVVLADAGCAAQAERLTRGADLAARARKALEDGDLLTASDAVQAALASAQNIPQSLWDAIPRLLERYRDARHPDLYASSPGGAATADGTRAAYYLLA